MAFTQKDHRILENDLGSDFYLRLRMYDRNCYLNGLISRSQRKQRDGDLECLCVRIKVKITLS